MGSTPAVRASSPSSASSSSGSTPWASTATMNPRSGSPPGAGSGWRTVTGRIMPAITPDSATRAVALVSIPSVRRDEAAVAAYVAEAMPWDPVFANDDLSTLWARRDGKPLVVFAGHLDTVPAQGNLPGRIEDGWVLGLGAADMKGGLAVMVELARWLAEERPATVDDAGFLFFPREEIGSDWNPLPGLFDECPQLRDAALAILMEPTEETIQAGCNGHLVARQVFQGRGAHSARPR